MEWCRCGSGVGVEWCGVVWSSVEWCGVVWSGVGVEWRSVVSGVEWSQG